jgi:hypothetical protein
VPLQIIRVMNDIFIDDSPYEAAKLIKKNGIYYLKISCGKLFEIDTKAQMNNLSLKNTFLKYDSVSSIH